jgi:hypothetical protein
MLENRKKKSNQEEKIRAFYYVFLGLFFVTLFVEALKIIYVLFTRGAKAVMMENTAVFIIFFVFLLFSIAWKVIVQQISSTETPASKEEDVKEIELTNNDKSTVNPTSKGNRLLNGKEFSHLINNVKKLLE